MSTDFDFQCEIVEHTLAQVVARFGDDVEAITWTIAMIDPFFLIVDRANAPPLSPEDGGFLSADNDAKTEATVEGARADFAGMGAAQSWGLATASWGLACRWSEAEREQRLIEYLSYTIEGEPHVTFTNVLSEPIYEFNPETGLYNGNKRDQSWAAEQLGRWLSLAYDAAVEFRGRGALELMLPIYLKGYAGCSLLEMAYKRGASGTHANLAINPRMAPSPQQFRVRPESAVGFDKHILEFIVNGQPSCRALAVAGMHYGGTRHAAESWMRWPTAAAIIRLLDSDSTDAPIIRVIVPSREDQPFGSALGAWRERATRERAKKASRAVSSGAQVPFVDISSPCEINYFEEPTSPASASAKQQGTAHTLSEVPLGPCDWCGKTTGAYVIGRRAFSSQKTCCKNKMIKAGMPKTQDPKKLTADDRKRWPGSEACGRQPGETSYQQRAAVKQTDERGAATTADVNTVAARAASAKAALLYAEQVAALDAAAAEPAMQRVALGQRLQLYVQLERDLRTSLVAQLAALAEQAGGSGADSDANAQRADVVEKLRCSEERWTYFYALYEALSGSMKYADRDMRFDVDELLAEGVLGVLAVDAKSQAYSLGFDGCHVFGTEMTKLHGLFWGEHGFGFDASSDEGVNLWKCLVCRLPFKKNWLTFKPGEVGDGEVVAFRRDVALTLTVFAWEAFRAKDAGRLRVAGLGRVNHQVIGLALAGDGEMRAENVVSDGNWRPNSVERATFYAAASAAFGHRYATGTAVYDVDICVDGEDAPVCDAVLGGFMHPTNLEGDGMRKIFAVFGGHYLRNVWRARTAGTRLRIVLQRGTDLATMSVAPTSGLLREAAPVSVV